MKFCDERIQKHLLNGGKIKKTGNVGIVNCPIMFNNCSLEFANGGKYPFSILDLTVDTWEIVEPEYDWDKIIEDKILCLFSDNKGFKYNIFSTLRMKDNNLYYTDNGTTYKYCKPFNPEDYKIAKNIKEYEK